jgi:hypothetical protein
LLSTVAVSLIALAAPAMAENVTTPRVHRVIHRDLPVQGALGANHNAAYRTHPGFRGLHGDGNYPGDVYDHKALDYGPDYAPFG